jgi:hypothetical protein
MSKSWEQIIGGYASDTLTEEEKRQLFEAALHDQTLFDALADEEALKALLADPSARQQILASLQASGNPNGTASSHRSWLRWFRQPSSLAWAGSIAAMGLALIFGWQMEKDWGPLVEQEQQMEPSMSQDEDKDKNEEVFRSQETEVFQMKEQAQDLRKKDQMELERVARLSAPVSSPQPSTIAKASKNSERMRQPSPQVRSDDIPRKKVKKERRLKAKESVTQPPESAIVQNVPEEELMVAPSVASPEVEEKGLQQLARAPSFADRLQGGDAISSPSARELFYANKSRRVDAVGEELDGMRAQQLLGGTTSKAEKALTEEVSDLKDSQEVVQDFSQGETRGIRYSFVRRGRDGKEEAIDITQFSGKLSELLLAIESNVSGHLYVLTAYGKGKWQWMSPESLNVLRSSDGAIQVRAYQSVTFALTQVTDTLGKPVVSSITMLLATTPLGELGRWLGVEGSQGELEGSLTEHTATEVFIADPSLESGTPLRVNIPLEN